MELIKVEEMPLSDGGKYPERFRGNLVEDLSDDSGFNRFCYYSKDGFGNWYLTREIVEFLIKATSPETPEVPTPTSASSLKPKYKKMQIDKIQDKIAHWAKNTFGEGDRFFGVISHLEEEVEELKTSDGHLEEFADCLILLLNAAEQRGINTSTMFQAAEIKMKVNRLRKWGNKDVTGKVNHVPEGNEND